MLHLNAQNPNHIHPNTYSKSLIAFKPRQVLLSQHNSRTTMSASALKDESTTMITSLTPELRGALHESILHYLSRNGFSKTLKRFQSEAQIQSDAWKGSSLHLEDIFCKYSPWDADSNNSKKLVNDVGTEKEQVHLTNEETTTKKKKKKATVDGDNGTAKDLTEVMDKQRNESSKNLVQISEDITVNEQDTKPKKKKTKHDMDSSIDTISGLKIDDPTMKTEKKKKSIEQVMLEPSTTNENEFAMKVAQKEKKKKKQSSTDENETIQSDLSNTKEKKSNEKVALELSTANKNELVTEVAQKEKKKKKKSSTDENETIQPDLLKTKAKKKISIEQVTLEPSTTNENGLVTEVAQKEKKKKKKSTTDDNETFQPDLLKQEKKSSKKRKRSLCDENENENGDFQNTETFKEEKSKREENNVHEISKKQLDGETNGKLEMDGVKSTKKQRIAATDEPKTVNAFQRVKIDQVEFAHEKLQDNSYWAKDGADIGYGAKAQEVLGQVRGRDFRHEKTKKKRGSYRGGSIDLQSHSVKFNYSDEE